MRKYPFVKQEGIKDCGVSCLSMVIQYYGGFVPIEKLREESNTDQSGVTAYHLMKCANNLGFHAKGMKGTIANLEDGSIQFPIIAHVLLNGQMGHYIVIYKIDKKKRELLIADPSDRIKKISYDEFLNIWSGVFLLLYPHKRLPFFNQTFSIFEFFKLFINEYKKELFQLFLFSIFIILFSVLQSFFFEIFIDKMQISKEMSSYFFLFYLFVILILFKQITNFFRSKLLMSMNVKIDYFLHQDIFEALIFLPYRYYKTRTTGEVAAKMNDLEIVRSFMSEAVTTILVDCFLGIVCFICLCFLHLKLSLLSIFVGLLLLSLNFLFQKCMKRRIARVQIARADVHSFMIESFQGFSSIKNLFQENKTVQRYMRKYLDYINHYQSLYDVSFNQTILKELVIDIGNLAILFVGILEILKGHMTLGSLVSFQMLTSYFFMPFQSIFSISFNYQEVKSALSHIAELFYQEEKIPTFHCPVQFPVSMQNLTYSFREDTILKFISFDIKEGEKILFVGNSGGGKSTLMKILLKYLPVERAMVYFSSIDINDISEEQIKQFISYISQEEILFTESLWYNLTLGQAIEEEEVFKVARICEVDKIANRDSFGYFQILEENGFHLSGGEKERIILARTLLLKRPLLIVDEGMGQMDISQERRILKNIFENFKELTFIMISHRMNNRDLFTRLVELEKGVLKKDVSKNV